MLAIVNSRGATTAWNRLAQARIESRKESRIATEDDGEITHGSAQDASNAPEDSWAGLIPNELERVRLVAFLSQQNSGALEVRADGSEWIRVHTPAPVNGDDHRIVIIENITQHTQIVDELRDHCGQLDRLLMLSRQDRKLIAYEIHDGIVQEMTAAQMFLEAGLAGLRSDPEVLDKLATSIKSLEDSVHWLHRSIEGSRDLINGLQPPELESGGLGKALELMIANSPVSDIVSFEANDEFLDLDTALALSIYRIVQESLTNIWKHSHATAVTVKLQRGSAEVTVEITDNGKGFEVETAMRKRFGMKGMRMRAITFGGRFEVESAAGEGACIRATIPFISQ